MHGNNSILLPVSMYPKLSSGSKNAQDVKNFLDLVMMLCFKPVHRLPILIGSLGKWQYYHLKDWHKQWFEHLRKYNEDRPGSMDHARALLTPVFEQLNRCFQTTSWFLPTYKITRKFLTITLAELSPEVERACYLLACEESNDSDTGYKTALRVDDNAISTNSRRMRRILLHTTELWEHRKYHVPRNQRYVNRSITIIIEVCTKQYA